MPQWQSNRREPRFNDLARRIPVYVSYSSTCFSSIPANELPFPVRRDAGWGTTELARRHPWFRPTRWPIWQPLLYLRKGAGACVALRPPARVSSIARSFGWLARTGGCRTVRLRAVIASRRDRIVCIPMSPKETIRPVSFPPFRPGLVRANRRPRPALHQAWRQTRGGETAPQC